MAVTATPIFPQAIKLPNAQILPADTTTKKTLCAGGANGSRIEAISAASTDTTTRDLQFWMNNGTIDLLLFTINLPISAGNTNAIAAVDVLRSTLWPGLSYDANGNKTLLVPSGYTLKVAATTTVTAAKEIDVICISGDY